MKFYRDELMAIYENPQHQGVCNPKSFDIIFRNPHCGDLLHLTGITHTGEYVEVKYAGELCTIATVGAEKTIDFLEKCPVIELEKFTDEEFLRILGMEDVRLHCALLTFHALQSARKQSIIKTNQSL